MYDKLYEYIENFLSQLLCGFRTAISPIPTFTKTSKELEIHSFKIQCKFSAIQRQMQSKQSKFKGNENFTRFPSFQFCS